MVPSGLENQASAWTRPPFAGSALTVTGLVVAAGPGAPPPSIEAWVVRPAAGAGPEVGPSDAGRGPPAVAGAVPDPRLDLRVRAEPMFPFFFAAGLDELARLLGGDAGRKGVGHDDRTRTAFLGVAFACSDVEDLDGDGAAGCSVADDGRGRASRRQRGDFDVAENLFERDGVAVRSAGAFGDGDVARADLRERLEGGLHGGGRGADRD